MSDPFAIRLATRDDVAVIARHRAQMFSDMGDLPENLYDELVERTVEYLREAIPAAAYIGWVATPRSDAGRVIGGAGVQLRRTLPHPLTRSGQRRVASGRQAIVLNVYTEKPWRRQGLADLLMGQVIAWARGADVDTLVLHASAEGRSLYERLGFIPTSEMRYPGL